MPISTSNGFSKDELDQCRGWLLPDISNGGEISASVKKAKVAREDAAAKENKQAKRKNVEESIEAIEDVASEALEKSNPPISAEQLQVITETAEKEGFDTGFKQGLEQGKEEGLANGLQEGKQLIQEQSQRLQHIIDTLLTPLENEKKQLEQLLVEMTCRLAETIIERELKTDSSLIVELVDQVLSLLPQSIPAFSLTLNPDDVALVESHLQDRLSNANKDDEAKYRLLTDEQILPGGCRLESSQSSVDATVETKIKTLLDDFVQQRHTEPTSQKVEPRKKVSGDDSKKYTIENNNSQVNSSPDKQDKDLKQHPPSSSEGKEINDE